MKKKNIIIASVVALFIIVWIGTTLLVANDDYTCYNYTSSLSSCSSNKTTCTPWTSGVRYCDWINVTTYTRWNSYSCSSRRAERRITYSINWTCRVKYTDTQTPKIPSWWIE